MHPYIKNALGVVAILAIAGVAIAVFDAVNRWGAAADAIVETSKQAQPVLANLTTATGEWSTASKAQAQAATAITRDIRAELWHIDKTLTTANQTITGLGETVSTINEQAKHVGPLLDAGTKTMASTTDVILALKQPIQNTNTLILKANRSVDDVNSFIKNNSPILHQLAVHTDGAMANVQGISGDVKIFADKQVAPKTKGQKVLQWLPVMVKGPVGVICMISGGCNL